MSKLAIGFLLVTALASAGCGESECEECAECSFFLGEYYGTIESLNETCADVVLLTGDEYMKVLSATPFSFESRDSRGYWAVFEGTLCNTADEDYPKQYTFNAYYRPDTTGQDYSLDYTLVGFFSSEDETSEVITVTATLDLRFVFDDGEICTLSGDVRLSKAL